MTAAPPRVRRPAPAPARALVRVRRRRLPPAPVDVDRLAAAWRRALGAAERAVVADLYLAPAEGLERRRLLAAEGAEALEALRALARNQGRSDRFLHVTTPRMARRVLGLGAGVVACVFDLEGVLTGGSEVHAAAWRETFDPFLARRGGLRHDGVAPFHARSDYPAYLEGRSRLDGVRELLASRGISLPEGRPDDPPGTESVHGLANRKREALARRLRRRGLRAFEGTRAYLELAREGGIACGVVSASASTRRILARAGLAPLVDGIVDGDAVVGRALRPRPAPDMLLETCRRLGVEARRSAAFEATRAGVEAARAAGFAQIVGVDRGGERETLLEAGATRVVAGLDEILDRAFAPTRSPGGRLRPGAEPGVRVRAPVRA